MKCEEANQVGMTEYLYALGFIPAKIRGNDYWYISPFRDETEASFKVNIAKNVWYDHGEGKGGSLIDFTMQYHNCNITEALQKVVAYLSYNRQRFIASNVPSNPDLPGVTQPDLFDKEVQLLQQKFKGEATANSQEERPPFHLHKNSLINHRDAAETAIEIIAANKPITDSLLCRYLKERRIAKAIVDTYCHEVQFKFSNKDMKHTAIRFKNSAGGYEFRNSFFKLSSSPKYVTYINAVEQNDDTKTDVIKNISKVISDSKNEQKNNSENILNQSLIVSQNEIIKSSLKSDIKDKIDEQSQRVIQPRNIAVFEGFFDFLSYLTIHQNQSRPLTDFLVLNSLAFFERSAPLMEKHEHIHLYLDNDEAGKKCLDIAIKRSSKYTNESTLYEGYKDLSDWVMHFGKLPSKRIIKAV